MQQSQIKLNHMPSFLRVNWPRNIKSFKSTCIELSKDVVDYLNEDAIFLNDQWRKGKQIIMGQMGNNITFPSLETLLGKVLSEYEGKVFIKLNWRCPLDCNNWLLNMCCEDIYDIFMALKTSAIIMDMMEDYSEWIDHQKLPNECQIIRKGGQEQIDNVGYYLEVRKWYKLDPLREYSCFVYQNKLVGISQRNLYVINKSLDKVKLGEHLESYFKKELQDIFKPDNYIFNVYIEKNENILVVDIDPWREYNQAKLFTFEELESLEKLEIRVVAEESQLIQEDLSAYRMPSEFTECESFEDMLSNLQALTKDKME